MENTEINIFDIMACNVYWDFENSPMPKETHKFLVALYPTPGVVAPDLIANLCVNEIMTTNKRYT